MDESEDLYAKEWGKEKEKIASNVLNYKISYDGKTVIYVDKEQNLYLKKQDTEKEKIASNVTNALLSEDGNVICFEKDNSSLYVRNLCDENNCDNQKIFSEEIAQLSISYSGNRIIYLGEYNHNKLRGELYLYEYGKEAEKIASDVTNYYMIDDEDKLYYSNEEKNLYEYSIKESKKRKISTEIEAFHISKDRKIVYYKDQDSNLYAKYSGKDKEKIGNDVVKWGVSKNGVVYLSKDKDLYTGEYGREKEKIDCDVIIFVIGYYGNSFAYYNKNNELSLKINGENTQKIIYDLNKYIKVYFENTLLYEKKYSMMI